MQRKSKSEITLQRQRVTYASDCHFNSIDAAVFESQVNRKIEIRKKIISKLHIAKSTFIIISGIFFEVMSISDEGIILFLNSCNDLDPLDLLEGNIIKAKVIKKGKKIICTKRV